MALVSNKKKKKSNQQNNLPEYTGVNLQDLQEEEESLSQEINQSPNLPDLGEDPYSVAVDQYQVDLNYDGPANPGTGRDPNATPDNPYDPNVGEGDYGGYTDPNNPYVVQDPQIPQTAADLWNNVIGLDETVSEAVAEDDGSGSDLYLDNQGRQDAIQSGELEQGSYDENSTEGTLPGFDPEAEAILRALLGFDYEGKADVLKQQAENALGQNLADLDAQSAWGGLGLTGAQTALAGDMRNKSNLDLQGQLMALDDQRAAQQLEALEFFDRSADRVREDALIELLKEQFGLNGEDLDSLSEPYVDQDEDGFDDRTGLPEDQYNERQNIGQWLMGAVGGTVGNMIDPNGDLGGARYLADLSELPPGSKWIRTNNGMMLFRDEDGNNYFVPQGA